jgi:hypothetical protein
MWGIQQRPLMQERHAMISLCTVTSDGRTVTISVEDAALVAQLAIHFPLRFRPLRGPHLETTLLGTQPGYNPTYTIMTTTLRITRADLAAAVQKAGAAWPGRIDLRDGEVVLTQLE